MAQIGLPEITTATDNFFRRKGSVHGLPFAFWNLKWKNYLDNIKYFYFVQLCILIVVFFIEIPKAEC